MSLRLRAEEIKASDLKPGDLFSIAPPGYWDQAFTDTVGEKVFIRTEAECIEEERNLTVTRIIIGTDEEVKEENEEE